MSTRSSARLCALCAAVVLLTAPAAAPAQSLGRYLSTIEFPFGYARIGFEETAFFNGEVIPGRRAEVTIDGMQFGTTLYLPLYDAGTFTVGPHVGFTAIVTFGKDEHDIISRISSGGVLGFDFPLFVGMRVGRGATLKEKSGIGGGLGVGALPIIYLFDEKLRLVPAALAEFRFGTLGVTALRLIYSMQNEHWETLTSQKFSADLLMRF